MDGAGSVDDTENKKRRNLMFTSSIVTAAL